jgi:uncharacterized protein (UPF0248 family)
MVILARALAQRIVWRAKRKCEDCSVVFEKGLAEERNLEEKSAKKVAVKQKI